MKSFKQHLIEANTMIHAAGSTVAFPHKGKMTTGKVVRYEKGGDKLAPHYVISHGEEESSKVPPHKVEKYGIFNEELQQKFQRATKTDVHYTGQINGKTYVVPHAFHGSHDVLHGTKVTPIRHSIVVSPTHVQHNNPSLSPEEVARVHSHIKDIHGGQDPKRLGNLDESWLPMRGPNASKETPVVNGEHAQWEKAHAPATRRELKAARGMRTGAADRFMRRYGQTNEERQLALHLGMKKSDSPAPKPAPVVKKPAAPVSTKSAEEKEAEHQNLEEKTLTPAETAKKEELVHKMKPKLQGFKERYGKDAKSVMYATATKQAKQLAEELHAYDVHHKGKHIDTIFYGHHEPVEEVKKSLINHDGYHPDITVRKQPKAKKLREEIQQLDESEKILKGFVPQWKAADKEHALKLAALKKKQKSISIFVKEKSEQLDELKMPKFGFVDRHVLGATHRGIVKNVHGMAHSELSFLHKNHGDRPDPKGSPAEFQHHAIKRELNKRGDAEGTHKPMDKSKFVKKNLEESQQTHSDTFNTIKRVLRENYMMQDRRFQGGYEIPHSTHTEYHAWGQVTHHSDAEAKADRDAKAKEWKQQGHKVTKHRSTNAIYDPDGPFTTSGTVYSARKHHAQ